MHYTADRLISANIAVETGGRSGLCKTTMEERHRKHRFKAPVAVESDTAGGDKVVDINPGLHVSHIRNKVVRSQLLAQIRVDLKRRRAAARRKRRAETETALEEGREPPRRKIPRTLEGVREPDDNWVEQGDNEVEADEDQDEFSAHFRRERPPKVGKLHIQVFVGF